MTKLNLSQRPEKFLNVRGDRGFLDTHYGDHRYRTKLLIDRGQGLVARISRQNFDLVCRSMVHTEHPTERLLSSELRHEIVGSFDQRSEGLRSHGDTRDKSSSDRRRSVESGTSWLARLQDRVRRDDVSVEGA